MTAERVPAEIEIKLGASSAADLRQVGRLRTLGRYRFRARPTAALHSIYLDTRTFALARAGVALRLRRSGTAWEITAKWSGRVAGALHDRPELTIALPGEPAMPFSLPDGPLRTQLTAIVLGRRLAPVLITDVRRQLRDVLPAEADDHPSLAELALDTVVLRAPDGSEAAAPYYEVEIERRSGRNRDLKELARLLHESLGLVPSPGSKFLHGLTALHGDAVPAHTAEPIAATDSVGLAVRKLVAAQLARVRAADPGTRMGEPEALHEQRVAVRRLRAAVRTFADGFPPRLQATLPDELRWLGQELGAVRDLDVQRATLAWHIGHVERGARNRLAGLRRHMEHERADRRNALGLTLNSPRYFQLLGTLERFAVSVPPQRPRGDAAAPIADFGRRAAKRSLRRLIKRGDAIGEVPEADDLHALRIRAKRLRYTLEALAPITGSQGRKLIKLLVRLQDVLGRFNDAMVAAAFIRDYRASVAIGASEAVRTTLSALADAELRRAGAAQSDFARAWRRFCRKSIPGLRRALLRRLKAAARREDASAGAAATAVQEVPPS